MKFTNLTSVAAGVVGLLLLTSVSPVGAIISSCVEPNCGSGNEPPPRYAKSLVTYKRDGAAKSAVQARAKMLGGEGLQAGLAGQWDTVDAVVTFPFTGDGGLELQVVALGLPAEFVGGDQYRASGWHRELFFLDIGDSVPRLLSAYLLDPEFEPEPDEALIESGQLWLVPYVLYQEAEELAGDPDFYAGFPEGAVSADVLFVADADGNVIDASVDIYDTAGEYQYSVVPQVGDRYNPGFVAYDLNDPDILYVLTYFDELVEFTDEISVERRYVVPSAATDPQLPAGFDSADLAMSFLLEGIASDNGEAVFGYSDLQSLGYTWGEAKDTAVAPVGGGGGSGGIGPWLLVLLAGLAAWRRRPARAAAMTVRAG